MSRPSVTPTTIQDDMETLAPFPILDPILRRERLEPDKDTIVRDFAYSFDDFLFWNFTPVPEAPSSISVSESSDELDSARATGTEQDGFHGAPPWLQSAHDGGLSEEDQSSHSHDDELHGRAVALFEFSPEHENEFALTEGQIIYISSRHGLGWLVAVDMESGDCGLVPEEYVRLLEEEDEGFDDSLSDPLKLPEKGHSTSGKDGTSLGHDRSTNSLDQGEIEEWVDEPEEMDTSTTNQSSELKPQELRKTQKDPADLTDAERQAIFDAAEREMRMNDAMLSEM